MTKEEAKRIEQLLIDKGYRLYSGSSTSSEDYGYFKSGAVTEDEYGDRKVGYQIEFRFWDWTKYGRTDNTEDAFGIDIIILVSAAIRVDMIISYTDDNIDNVEKIADDFYKFAIDHKLF